MTAKEPFARVERVYVLVGDGDALFHIGPFQGYHDEAEKKAAMFNKAFSKAVSPLVEALEKIGNAIGAPTMSYSPEVEREELLKRVQLVSKIVVKALGAFNGK